MSLYTRLLGLDPQPISVHAFMAALGELDRAQVTRQQVVDAFGLDAAEAAELDAITAKLTPIPESYSFNGDVTLTNIGTTYDSAPALQARALGFIRLQAAGITGVELTVRYNQSQAGRLDWQLYNETDAQQVALVSTTGIGTNKEQTATVGPFAPLAPGLKTLRLRVQVATLNDDAYLHGWCLRLTRAGVVRSDTLHEVLLLGREGYAYTTEAALKNRLGVA